MSEIELYDGNTGKLVSTVPAEEVQAVEGVPVARVVKTSVSEAGQHVPQEQADYVIITEFDKDGHWLRETRLRRKGSASPPA